LIEMPGWQGALTGAVRVGWLPVHCWYHMAVC
jgi:hypothetical protein